MAPYDADQYPAFVLNTGPDESIMRKRQQKSEEAATPSLTSPASQALFLTSLMDHIPDNIYFKDCDGHFLLINKAMADYFGLKSPQDAVSRTDFDFFSEEHALAARGDELDVMRTGKPIVAKEEKETWPNGAGATWVSTTKVPLYDASGKLIGTFGVSRDITEKKLAEESLHTRDEELQSHRVHLEDMVAERTAALQRMNAKLLDEIAERRRVESALRESEERYRLLIEGLPTYVYSVVMKDGKADSTLHGVGCVRVTGYTAEEYARNPNLWISMVHPEDRDMVIAFAATPVGAGEGKSIEHRIINKNGQLRWVRNTIVHHYNPEGDLVRYDGLVEDITDRKHSEEVRREGEKTRAVSDLASAVAHSFNNVISVIMGNAASIADNLLPNTRCHEDAERIIEAAKHAGELTRRLLSVARALDTESDMEIGPVALNEVIAETTGLLERTFSEKGIRIIVRDSGRLPYVRSNASQLLDALVSIFVNAAEAMPDGGTITVKVSVKRFDRPAHRWNAQATAGNHVLLRISDTGVGMDKELQKGIFEPFSAKGTSSSAFGLALSVAQRMVKRWGGWISVRSQVNRGTTIRLFLPEAAPAKPVAPADVTAGRTVLLMDDDPALVTFMTVSLKAAGFNVLTAPTVPEGVALYRSHMDRIDVVVVDMVMPGTHWTFALEEIFDCNAQANVIVTSGFSRDFVRGHLNLGVWGFLQKPFDAEGLVSAVKNAVTRRPK